MSKPWYTEITPELWHVLIATFLGWMLDAFDAMIYAMTIKPIMTDWNLDTAVMGAITAIFMLGTGIGGVTWGFLADIIGRTRVLMITILWYSAFTGLCGLSQGPWHLALFRFLTGFGIGGEWATGAVLLAETWPPEHRGKVAGIMQSGWPVGYMCAAAVTWALASYLGSPNLTNGAWRYAYFIGILPALLTAYIRKAVPESKLWLEGKVKREKVDLSGVLRMVIFATILVILCQYAYWAVFSWLPTYLSKERGLGVIKSSIYIIAVEIGGITGHILYGFMADKIGRKPSFISFFIVNSLLVPYFAMYAPENLLFILGPVLGFFGHGFFSGFPAYLAELFPTKVRGAAQGFAYNFGRTGAMLGPYIVGVLALTYGLGAAISTASIAFIMAAIVVSLGPETKGKVLD